ncbi:hypothetical protein SGGMMB4_01534 [Sodalis glossinidius str. 'morsitans']|uniref:Uncharacterized protein n=1 Tax=Sodalis glossinidius (strain morsitans) TaxID=343509 RepID=A0A193QH11_SODGM|nr:hypothetical protein SGGMMB4_01534 [Sodalis glossinidius str. 'morsitans']
MVNFYVKTFVAHILPYLGVVVASRDLIFEGYI